MDIEKLENYVATEMNKANIECTEAKKKDMTRENQERIHYLNGRINAYLDVVIWIIEKKGEESKEKFHVKGEKSG